MDSNKRKETKVDHKTDGKSLQGMSGPTSELLDFEPTLIDKEIELEHKIWHFEDLSLIMDTLLFNENNASDEAFS